MPEMERQATERCFERLFGFAERSYAPTRAALLRVAQFEWYNGRERCLLDLPCGRVSSGWHSAPSVRELRDDVIQLAQKARPTRGESWWSSVVQTYSHVVGESTQLHSAHPGGVFQAASQFNLLEFIDPEVVPEDGIANYIYDRTQGPACAVACLAGTAYRNYLIHPSFVSGEPLRSSEAVDSALRGQRHDWQANMLADVTAFISGPHPTRGESTLGPVDASQLYTIRNGYFHASTEQSQRLHQRLCAVAASRAWSMDQLMDELSDLVRVGVVEETPVTHPLPKESSVMHVVTQTYNSALSLPPSYATKGEGSNEDGVALLAQTVLNGSYEATLLCAARSTLNLLPTPGSSGEWKPPPTFLTKVGGGVFHNPQRWIQRAIARARTRMRTLDVPMDVRLVHFGQLDQSFVELAYSD